MRTGMRECPFAHGRLGLPAASSSSAWWRARFFSLGYAERKAKPKEQSGKALRWRGRQSFAVVAARWDCSSSKAEPAAR